MSMKRPVPAKAAKPKSAEKDRSKVEAETSRELLESDLDKVSGGRNSRAGL